jgi:DNA-binding YbaB/EbfC family protein
MNTPNMQQILKQAQKMQEQIKKQMEELVVEASAGGGMVTVKMNGQKQLLAVSIDPEALSSSDREMIQDLVLAAVNEANRKVDEQLQGEIGNLAGGMKIPSLF